MTHRVAAVAVLLAMVAAACGGHDHSAGSAETSAARTIRIEMRDTAYAPEAVEVERGETVRFVFSNKGKLPHDAFVGDEAAQIAHEAEMREGDSGHRHNRGDSGVTVQPGKTAALTERFEDAGTTYIGCHEAGHWDAGMRVAVTVA